MRRGPFFFAGLDLAELLRWLMVGIVRLYVQPHDHLPTSCIPEDFKPVVDCLDPEEADLLRSVLRSQGYEVLSVPL